MPFPHRDDGQSGPRTGAEWCALLRRTAVSAGIIGAFLLPVSASASDRGIAKADLTALESSAGMAMPGPIAISATPVSDAMLAAEEAKGLPEPEIATPKITQPPRVILWDEIDRPGGWSPTGNGVTIITVTGGP
jgi:hypothetical protein